MLPTLFDYEGQKLMTFSIDGEPWFLGSEICQILEISNSRDAVSRLSESMKRAVGIADTIGRTQQRTLISEAGIYKLVFTSRKPEAEKFTDWLAEEVIPSIRKTGSYIVQPKLPQTYAAALRELADAWEQNQLLLPKAESFDTFMDAKNNQTMNVVAKSLGIGRNKLFDLLRQHKVFMANNTPFQTYIERGYFEVKEKPITMGDNTFNKPQTFVSAKGVVFLEKFLKEKAVLV